MKLLPSFSIFILIILSAPISKAQEVFLPGSRSQSLAGFSVSLRDCWSIFGNQAGLAQIDHLTIGGSFQNPFLVRELSTSSGLVVLPIHSSVFAFSAYQFGKTTFRQEKLGIAYARSLNPRLHFGVQFNYYRFFLAEENKTIGTSGLELGFQYQLTKQILLGIHALNPYQTSISTRSGKYSYPTQFNAGAYFLLSESIAFVTEFQKDLLYPLNIKTGLEYDVRNKLYIRTGISTNPYQLTGGMGFSLKMLTFDLAVAYNQYLGNSPSASFQFQF